MHRTRVALIALAFASAACPVTSTDPAPLRAGPLLLLFRQGADASVEAIADGTEAREGDAVQAAYVAAGNLQGVIVSLDGDGLVTLHYPDEPHETTRLEPAKLTPLDHSFVLDDARHFERFVLVSTADRDMDVSVVLQAATTLARRGPIAEHARLDLPAGWNQTSLRLRKRSP